MKRPMCAVSCGGGSSLHALSTGSTAVHCLKQKSHSNNTSPAAFCGNVIFNVWLFHSSGRPLTHSAHWDTQPPYQHPAQAQFWCFGAKHLGNIRLLLISLFTVPCPWRGAAEEKQRAQLKSPAKTISLFGFLPFFSLLYGVLQIRKCCFRGGQRWPLVWCCKNESQR